MPSGANYGDPLYWEKRYKDSPTDIFDWLEDYSTLKYVFAKYSPKK